MVGDVSLSSSIGTSSKRSNISSAWLASDGTDPRFRQHIEEIEARLEAAREPGAAAGDWKLFPPESGTLGVPRDQMPQIRNEDRPALVDFVEIARHDSARGSGASNGPEAHSG